MGQAQINVRTQACSGTFIAKTKQAALTHNVRGERLNMACQIATRMTMLKKGHVCNGATWWFLICLIKFTNLSLLVYSAKKLNEYLLRITKPAFTPKSLS